LTAARDVIRGTRAIPPKNESEESIMNATSMPFAPSANVFTSALTLDAVRQRAPAVFAPSPHERTSSKYTFIPTERVLSGLMEAGFVPVEARQTQARRASPLHARHVVRLRRRLETVQLKDSVPEVVFLNSHDGTSSYQLRVGIFRVVCTNGLIVSRGAFPGVYVPHRGNVVEEVIAGALQIAQRFDGLALEVERMESRMLRVDEQFAFAGRALALRFPNVAERGMQPLQLLTIRRAGDTGQDLWSTLNKVQENLIRGGLTRRTATGRLSRTRGITAIRRDVELNSRLWDLAAEVLAA
jgi:hypothetical protein